MCSWQTVKSQFLSISETPIYSVRGKWAPKWWTLASVPSLFQFICANANTRFSSKCMWWNLKFVCFLWNLDIRSSHRTVLWKGLNSPQQFLSKAFPNEKAAIQETRICSHGNSMESNSKKQIVSHFLAEVPKKEPSLLCWTKDMVRVPECGSHCWRLIHQCRSCHQMASGLPGWSSSLSKAEAHCWQNLLSVVRPQKHVRYHHSLAPLA